MGLNRLSHIIETLPVGMSNRTGTAKLYVHEKANLHTLNAAKYHDYRNQPKYADTLEIDVMSIGDFIRDHEPIDFVRMDIEGHEVEILEGLGAAIPQYHCSPRVLFENHFPKYDDAHHSMREPLSNLFSLGYYAKTMVSNDEATARFKDMGYQPLTVIKTDGVFRGLYEGVSKNDALTLICDIGTVRATLIERAGVPAQ